MTQSDQKNKQKIQTILSPIIIENSPKQTIYKESLEKSTNETLQIATHLSSFFPSDISILVSVFAISNEYIKYTHKQWTFDKLKEYMIQSSLNSDVIRIFNTIMFEHLESNDIIELFKIIQFSSEIFMIKKETIDNKLHIIVQIKCDSWNYLEPEPEKKHPEKFSHPLFNKLENVVIEVMEDFITIGLRYEHLRQLYAVMEGMGVLKYSA